MMAELVQEVVGLVSDWGYIGIFLLMALESSFVPFPSEVVLIPAGYLAFKGDMSIAMIMLSALGGAIVGSFVNYFLALFLGRRFLEKYGKYFFIKEEVLLKMDTFFAKHGHISTFTGRLIPGVRQLISIPAGLARMNMLQFSIFTILGAGIWAMILVALGYFIGQNQELIHVYLKELTVAAFVFVVVLGFAYYRYEIYKANKVLGDIK